MLNTVCWTSPILFSGFSEWKKCATKWCFGRKRLRMRFGSITSSGKIYVFIAFYICAVHYFDVHFLRQKFWNLIKALKTQVLKEKTQIIKRKGLSPKKGNDVPPTKIMKKETVSIQRRLGERIQLQTTTNGDNGPRRVIKSKRYRCRHNE